MYPQMTGSSQPEKRAVSSTNDSRSTSPCVPSMGEGRRSSHVVYPLVACRVFSYPESSTSPCVVQYPCRIIIKNGQFFKLVSAMISYVRIVTV